ncbi:plasmid pRiA4b ORF-3 family protein [bacterium]|nr:plasmid pRiA4b ORF-3 family protein [bacterium]
MKSKTYQVSVFLMDIEPKISRVLLVPENTTLARLHDIIQTAFGWENYHLREFVIGDSRYGPDPEMMKISDDDEYYDEKDFSLKEFVDNGVASILYIYDMGDYWQHQIQIKSYQEEYPENMPSPVCCLSGQRAAPPEDIGGVPGYYDFCSGIQDPSHPQHEDYLSWYSEVSGSDELYNPDFFDLEAVNRLLSKL